VLQSVPFVLVGVFAATVVQQRLRGEVVARWMPRLPLAAVLLSSLSGLVAPVCDCGAVPLGRRLMAKGVPVYAALSFVIAAPVINPVTLCATAIAFQGRLGIVVLRVTMTLSVAVCVGLIAAARHFEVPTLAQPLDEADKAASVQPLAQLRDAVSQASVEYAEVLFFVVIGALFTAASQTLLPRTDIASLGGQQAGSVLALMPVATILSICSEADAFVARAFATNFSLGAVLAFMTIGQIVDLRNSLLVWRVLGGRLLALVVLVSYPLVFLEGVALNRLLALV
jgi:uncharacterized protein